MALHGTAVFCYYMCGCRAKETYGFRFVLPCARLVDVALSGVCVVTAARDKVGTLYRAFVLILIILMGLQVWLLSSKPQALDTESAKIWNETAVF